MVRRPLRYSTFFSQRSSHHRDLHSFPTRRSSDLACCFVFPPTRMATAHFSVLKGLRSEEHTSELQSHHDLVCRLLLEKKNLRLALCSFSALFPTQRFDWIQTRNLPCRP